MPTSSTLLAFCAATIVFVAIPGPNLLYIVGHGVSGGRRQALTAAIGVEIGTLVHIAAAVAGLSAVLARSSAAFATVKYVGIAYLVYLGVSALRAPSSDDDSGQVESAASRGPLLKGIIVNVLNPKAALFFLAFFPQFIDPTHDTTTQALVLGGALFAIALSVDVVYATTAALVGRRLTSRSAQGATGRRLIGGIYFTLAGVAALTGQHQSAS